MYNMYLVVIRTVGAFFYARVLLYFAHLHANYGIHVQAGQLSGFDDSYAHLEVLGLEGILCGVHLIFVFQRSRKRKKYNERSQDFIFFHIVILIDFWEVLFRFRRVFGVQRLNRFVIRRYITRFRHAAFLMNNCSRLRAVITIDQCLFVW